MPEYSLVPPHKLLTTTPLETTDPRRRRSLTAFNCGHCHVSASDCSTIPHYHTIPTPFTGTKADFPCIDCQIEVLDLRLDDLRRRIEKHDAEAAVKGQSSKAVVALVAMALRSAEALTVAKLEREALMNDGIRTMVTLTAQERREQVAWRP